MNDGWEPIGKTYSVPQFRWWQFLKKYRFKKAMQRFTPGGRIKSKSGLTFSDDYQQDVWVKLREDR